MSPPPPGVPPTPQQADTVNDDLFEPCPGSEEVVGVVVVAEDPGVEVAVEEVSSGRVVK